jgi:hypothetical protein
MGDTEIPEFELIFAIAKPVQGRIHHPPPGGDSHAHAGVGRRKGAQVKIGSGIRRCDPRGLQMGRVYPRMKLGLHEGKTTSAPGTGISAGKRAQSLSCTGRTP